METGMVEVTLRACDDLSSLFIFYLAGYHLAIACHYRRGPASSTLN